MRPRSGLTSFHVQRLFHYDGNPVASPTPTGPVPIVVDQLLAMDATSTLSFEFGDSIWGSTICFAPGIPKARGGTLELSFDSSVNLASQLGRAIDLFDWTGVAPTGIFNVSSRYSWNVANLYTTGEVTLTPCREPSSATSTGTAPWMPPTRASGETTTACQATR